MEPAARRVVIEDDDNEIPFAITTIQRNGDAVYSRQPVNDGNTLSEPSRSRESVCK